MISLSWRYAEGEIANVIGLPSSIFIVYYHMRQSRPEMKFSLVNTDTGRPFLAIWFNEMDRGEVF